MNDCIFCKLLRKEMPSYPVYEDEHTFAFIDIFGATDGHVCVIHKRHEPKMTGLSDEEVQDLFVAVKKVALAIEKAYRTEILTIGINHGEPAGVKHIHVHIMPRYEGDGGGIIQSLPAKILSDKDFPAVSEKIKSHIGK